MIHLNRYVKYNIGTKILYWDHTQPPKPPTDPFHFPIYQAAHGLRECLRPYIADVPLKDLVLHLQTASGDLEAALATQARMLDSVFSRLVAHGARPKEFSPAILATALKAQKQFRDTFRTLENLEDKWKNKRETDYRIPDHVFENKD